MKGLKKLFTVFLVLIIAVTSLPLMAVSASAYSGILDLNKMTAYADKYWYNYNPTYQNNVTADFDCCHFASQIVIAGGLEKDLVYSKYVPDFIDKLKSDAFYNKYGTRVEYYNNYQYTYPSNGKRDRAWFTIDDIKPGDFVTLNGDYGRSHIVFVLKVDNSTQQIYFAAHTRDAHGFYGNEAENTLGIYPFSWIKGVLKTSDLIGTSAPAPAETGIVYGDINGDGKMTITDNVQINNNVVEKVANGEVPITDINARAADVDLDNAITKTDSELLKKALVGLVDLPVVGDHKCYIISPAISSTYTMDVEGGRNSDCTNIGAYGRHGANNQQFMVVPVYSAYTGSRKLYNRIIPLSDSSYTKCLNIDEANGNNLILYTFSGTINELWTFEPVKGAFNQYYIKSALGGALAVEGGYDGANIYLDDYNMFDNNQKWVLTEVTNPRSGSSVTEQLKETKQEEIKPTTADNFTLSQNGENFICDLEKFRDKCYGDSVGRRSIGYGTKCSGTHTSEYDVHYINESDALAAMRAHVKTTYRTIIAQTKGLTMNQNQFDALVSLCYNTGGGTSIISNSPLVRYLRGELTEEQARSQYSQYYIKSDGVKQPGLVTRRNKEADLFFSAVDNISVSEPTNDPAPSQVNSKLIDMQLVSTHIDNISYISYYNSYNTKEVVMALQRLLNEYGNYGLTVDGICGNATRNAIRSFQRDNGLTVDGLFGVASKNKLRERLDL